jgi:hypothetical protein
MQMRDPILLLTAEEEEHIVRAALGHWFYAQVGWQQGQDELIAKLEGQILELRTRLEELTAYKD